MVRTRTVLPTKQWPIESPGVLLTGFVVTGDSSGPDLGLLTSPQVADASARSVAQPNLLRSRPSISLPGPGLGFVTPKLKTAHAIDRRAACNGTVYICNRTCYACPVIRGFRHKGLDELFRKGRSRRVTVDLQKRALRRLDALEQAAALRDLNIPGFDFHPLRGKPQRYSLHATAPGASRSNGARETRGTLTGSSTIEVRGRIEAMIRLSADDKCPCESGRVLRNCCLKPDGALRPVAAVRSRRGQRQAFGTKAATPRPWPTGRLISLGSITSATDC